jgi:hypothetical protein
MLRSRDSMVDMVEAMQLNSGEQSDTEKEPSSRRLSKAQMMWSIFSSF